MLKHDSGYIDFFKGKTIEDLADNRVGYWQKKGDRKKIKQSNAVRDTIEKAIGYEVQGSHWTRADALF